MIVAGHGQTINLTTWLRLIHLDVIVSKIKLKNSMFGKDRNLVHTHDPYLDGMYQINE
jgi:hypothetical protein